MTRDALLPVLNVQERALKQRTRLRAVERRWNRGVGLTVGIWALLTLVLGAALTGGPPLILDAWLSILKAGVLTSPLMGLALRAVNRDARTARAALSAGDDADLELSHLSAAVAAFTRETRMARLALTHAAHHEESMRQLWDWRRSFDQLQERDAMTLAESGVGLGPIGDLLALADESTPDIDDAQLAKCVAHLQHVENLLVGAHQPVYR